MSMVAERLVAERLVPERLVPERPGILRTSVLCLFQIVDQGLNMLVFQTKILISWTYFNAL